MTAYTPRHARRKDPLVYFTTRKFWTDLTERSLSTAAQAALGGVTADGFGLIDLGSWQGVGVLAGTAAVIAVLKAFAVGRGDDPDAGLGD